MKGNKYKYLALSVILTSALHQKLMEVSAQEAVVSNEETAASTENIQPIQPAVTAEKVVEETVTSSEQSVTLDDVEAELSNSILEQVNDLRELNGLNRLEKNEHLEKSAEELVEKKPISEEFTDQYGNTHALDNQIAQKNGYNSNYIPANHVYSEVKLSDIQGKSLQEIAADFVNKWYLDMSNPDLAHRKQMLTKGWEETGVAVTVSPKLLVGEYKNEYIKSKFGDTIFNKNTLEILDGFEIHATQYFGSTRNYTDYSTVQNSLSLPDYRDYVESQIDKEELNPVTGEKITLGSRTALKEINRQEQINTLNAERYSQINQHHPLIGEFSEDKILNLLVSTKQEFNNFLVEGELGQSIKNKLTDELSRDDWQDLQVLELVKDGKILGNWKAVQEGTYLKLIDVSDGSGNTSINGRKVSISSSNIFKTEDEAAMFGKQFVKENPDYYFAVIKMADGQFSAYVQKKQVLTESNKLIIESKSDPITTGYGHVGIVDCYKNAIEDFKKIFVNFDAVVESQIINGEERVYLNISDTTPINYEEQRYDEDGNLLQLLREFDQPGVLNYLIDNGKLYEESDFLTNSIITYRNNNDKYEYLLLPYQSKIAQLVKDYPGWDQIEPLFLPLRTIALDYNLYDNFDKFPTSELALEAGSKMVRADQSVGTFAKIINGEGVRAASPSMYFFYPKFIDSAEFDTIEEARQVYLNLPDDVIYRITDNLEDDYSGVPKEKKYVIRPVEPNIKKESKQKAEEKKNTYIFYDESKLDAFNKEYMQTNSDYGFNVFKIGEAFALTYHPVYFEDTGNNKAFDSYESAVSHAKDFISKNSTYYYDIFKVDNTYIVQYGENRIETRWNPDTLHFDSQKNADAFAKYVSTLVKKYAYEIVPNHNGLYNIKTNSIVFFDDQEGLYLIPEYIGSGNSGTLGQNTTLNLNNLTDIYAKYREVPGSANPIPSKPIPAPSKPEESKPTPKPSVSDKGKEEKPEVIKPIEDISGKESIFVPTVYAVSSPTGLMKQNASEAEKSVAEQRIRAIPAEITMGNLINVVIQDIFKVTDSVLNDLKQTFDLMYHVEFMFKDVSKQDLEEPTKIEVVLADNEDVEQVVQYDIKNNKIVNELEYSIEERPLEQAKKEFPEFDFSKVSEDTVRVVVFEITESGDYGINFK